MFRESVNARYVLRAVVAAAIAALATLRASVGDGLDAQEWVDLVTNVVGALALYLGVGAVSGSVEPFVGKELEGAEVPVPPAQPDND